MGRARSETRLPGIRNERHKRDLLLRLRRIEGQLRGIQAMIAKDADCEQVSQQLRAARRALDKVFVQVLACAIEAGAEATPPAMRGRLAERLEHVAALLARFG